MSIFMSVYFEFLDNLLGDHPYRLFIDPIRQVARFRRTVRAARHRRGITGGHAPGQVEFLTERHQPVPLLAGQDIQISELDCLPHDARGVFKGFHLVIGVQEIAPEGERAMVLQENRIRFLDVRARTVGESPLAPPETFFCCLKTG